MATTTTKAKKDNGYVLPDDKLQQREAVYLIYQGMGPTRSIEIDR
jgi:hypothetical protein